MLVEVMAAAASAAAACVKMDWVFLGDNDRALMGPKDNGGIGVLKVNQAGIQTLAAQQILKAEWKLPSCG